MGEGVSTTITTYGNENTLSLEILLSLFAHCTHEKRTSVLVLVERINHENPILLSIKQGGSEIIEGTKWFQTNEC